MSRHDPKTCDVCIKASKEMDERMTRIEEKIKKLMESEDVQRYLKEAGLR